MGRKAKVNKQIDRVIGVRLPVETHDNLLWIAGAQGVTRNRLLNLAVERLLADELAKLKAEKQNPQTA